MSRTASYGLSFMLCCMAVIPPVSSGATEAKYGTRFFKPGTDCRDFKFSAALQDGVLVILVDDKTPPKKTTIGNFAVDMQFGSEACALDFTVNPAK